MCVNKFFFSQIKIPPKKKRKEQRTKDRMSQLDPYQHHLLVAVFTVVFKMVVTKKLPLFIPNGPNSLSAVKLKVSVRVHRSWNFPSKVKHKYLYFSPLPFYVNH